ncbi:MAG: hypothetical protein M1830_000385 [Pleopsidium flavum]|nr:MAG: hypothetical protein M1830_000385 [Pleopsidium flavum]
MTTPTSAGPLNLGGHDIEAFLPIAPIPGTVAEWASLIPLVCHLASYQHDYTLAGEAALMGRLSLGMFPRLGVSSGIARLLEQGPEFLERAAAMGNSSCEVWDVNWGSTFPCANGAASAIITAFALKGVRNKIKISESLKPKAKWASDGGGAEQSDENKSPSLTPAKPMALGDESSAVPPSTPAPNQAAASIFRRYQELHVLDFSRTAIKPTWHLKIHRLLSSLHFEILSTVFLLASAVLLGLYGLYGTAIAVLSGIISKIACRFLVLRRPPGFLTNNEKHDACMLVGVHRNCSVWYLYIGDRGVVDYLLNKPMVNPLKASIWLSGWFKIAHIVQLLAMTYVAARKGWDGVAMTILMLAAWTFSWQFEDKVMARHFLNASGVVIKARSFQFGGRTQMIGAIQSFSGSKVTSWMDSILAPCQRRQALLSRLGCSLSDSSAEPRTKGEALSGYDEDWVTLQAEIAKEAADVMRRELARKEKA